MYGCVLRTFKSKHHDYSISYVPPPFQAVYRADKDIFFDHTISKSTRLHRGSSADQTAARARAAAAPPATQRAFPVIMGIAALEECEALELAVEVPVLPLCEAVPVLVPVVVEPEPELVVVFVIVAVGAEAEAPVEAAASPV
jgi:hypothetical protein